MYHIEYLKQKRPVNRITKKFTHWSMCVKCKIEELESWQWAPLCSVSLNFLIIFVIVKKLDGSRVNLSTCFHLSCDITLFSRWIQSLQMLLILILKTFSSCEHGMLVGCVLFWPLVLEGRGEMWTYKLAQI